MGSSGDCKGTIERLASSRKFRSGQRAKKQAMQLFESCTNAPKPVRGVAAAGRIWCQKLKNVWAERVAGPSPQKTGGKPDGCECGVPGKHKTGESPQMLKYSQTI
jgi:hypothetical protein